MGGGVVFLEINCLLLIIVVFCFLFVVICLADDIGCGLWTLN